MFWDSFQIFLQIHSLHKTVKCRHWITDIQIIRNKDWQNYLFCVRSRRVNNYHCKLILTQEKDLGFVFDPWPFFVFRLCFFSQPLLSYIFFSNTLPHLEQTNVVFPFLPLIPVAAPTIPPTGPPNAKPTVFPTTAFPNENFFLVSAGIPIPSHPHVGHFIFFAIVIPPPKADRLKIPPLPYRLPLLFRNFLPNQCLPFHQSGFLLIVLLADNL